MRANCNEATQGKCEQSVYEMSQCMKYITALVGVQLHSLNYCTCIQINYEWGSESIKIIIEKLP